MYCLVKVLEFDSTTKEEFEDCHAFIEDNELDRFNKVSEDAMYRSAGDLVSLTAYVEFLHHVERYEHVPVIMSPTTKDWEFHRGMFDFDGLNICDVVDRCNEFNIHGHLYKTLHGIHLYADRLFLHHEYVNIATAMGACNGHITLGDLRGLWGLRCGLKKNRLPDIEYVGHSTGLEKKKDMFLMVRDALYIMHTRYMDFGLRLKPKCDF